MVKYYNINGKQVPAGQAALGVHDLSILRGYGIFDFFLVRRRQPVFFEDYLNRFFRSAELLNLTVPLTRDELRGHVHELIAANGLEEAGMRFVLTGGYADDGYTPVSPNLIIMEHPMPNVPTAHFDQGVKVITHRFQREIPEVKTINYLMGIRLQPELKRAGAIEPLYHDGTFVREAARSNFFLVTEDERVVTPATDILFGVTRRKVLELARNYFDVEEREVRLEELTTAREAFLTGSTKHVMPVVQIDNRPVGDGRPGAITRKLMELFEAYSMEYLRTPVG